MNCHVLCPTTQLFMEFHRIYQPKLALNWLKGTLAAASEFSLHDKASKQGGALLKCQDIVKSAIDQTHGPIHIRCGLVGWFQFKGTLGQMKSQGWTQVSNVWLKLANCLQELLRTPEKYPGVHISHWKVSQPPSEFSCPAIYSLQPSWALNSNSSRHWCHRRDVPIHVDHSNSRPPKSEVGYGPGKFSFGQLNPI